MTSAWICIWATLIYESTFPKYSTQQCNEIVVSPNGKLVAIGGRRDTRIYRGSALLATIPITNYRPSGMSLLRFADDKTLVVIGSDAVYSYSIPARKMVRQLPLRKNRDRAIILSDKIFVQEINQTTFKHFFRIFDIKANKGAKPISTHPSPHVNTGMSATNDGRSVAFFWGNTDVDFLRLISGATLSQIYNIESKTNSKKLPPAAGIQFSPDESAVVVCGSAISLFDWPGLSKRWSSEIGACHDIRFSPDGKLFAAFNQENDRLLVFDTNTGTELAKIKLNQANGSGFEFSKDGTSIWLPGQDRSGGIQEWQISSGRIGQRIGNVNKTRWIVFLLVFAGWAVLYCVTGTSSKTKTEIRPSISLWLSSVAKIATGVVVMASGILYSFNKMPMDQHATITAYIFAFIFTTFLLVMACLILTAGFSYVTAQILRFSTGTPNTGSDDV